MKDNRNKQNNEWQKIFQYLSLVTQVGLTVIVSILIFFFIGLYIDRKLGGSGIILIIFIIIGVFVGFYQTYKMIERISEIEDRRE